MKLIEYMTGKGGLMILALIAVVIFIYRKYREKRYFKEVEKRIDDRNNRSK